MSTQDHLTQAKEYIAQGDGYYRQAAEEIKAAMNEDPALTYAAVGEAIGKSKDYARRLVLALATSTGREELVIEWDSGSNRREDVLDRIARERPEEVAKAIAAAPPKAREEALGALALGGEEIASQMFHASVAGAPRPVPPKPPRPSQTWSAILSYLENARGGMMRALEELRDQPELNEQVRERLTEETRKVAAAAELLIAYLEEGGDGGMIDDISEYLAAQAAGEESSNE